jgi:hypothetical protein
MQQEIDWAGIRANAVAIGVREAARQVSSHLPPVEQKRFVDRVLQRSHREGWIRRKIQVMNEVVRLSPSPPSVNGGVPAKPLSSAVSMSSDGMANHLKTIKNKSRFNLSKFVLNASKVASRSRSPLQDARNVKDVAGVYSVLWPEERGSNALTLNVGVAIGGME